MNHSMFLYLKLVLAHLIGDFILQFEELYHLKVKSRWGHFWHVAIHAACILLCCFPYIGRPFMWIFAFTIATIHYFQDLLKYTLTQKSPKHTFWFFIIDQIIHFLFLAAIFLFPVSKEVLDFPNHPAINFYYAGNTGTLYAIAFISATFVGTYTLHAFRKTFLKDSRPDHFITSPEVFHNLIERSVITGLILFSTSPLIFIGGSLLIGLTRLPFKKLRNKLDFGLSFAFAALVGVIFKVWL